MKKELGELAIRQMEKVVNVMRVNGCSRQENIVYELTMIIREYSVEKSKLEREE